jgi:hypothetical protein
MPCFIFVDSSATFNFTFQLAENYPVDLYFLMDVSNSMADLRQRLVNLSDTLGMLFINFYGYSDLA